MEQPYNITSGHFLLAIYTRLNSKWVWILMVGFTWQSMDCREMDKDYKGNIDIKITIINNLPLKKCYLLKVFWKDWMDPFLP